MNIRKAKKFGFLSDKVRIVISITSTLHILVQNDTNLYTYRSVKFDSRIRGHLRNTFFDKKKTNDRVAFDRNIIICKGRVHKVDRLESFYYFDDKSVLFEFVLHRNLFC